LSRLAGQAFEHIGQIGTLGVDHGPDLAGVQPGHWITVPALDQ